MSLGIEPKFFTTPADWRHWLERYHDRERELPVGFYTNDSGKPSINWPESVDGSLCFGWIDGVRRRIDDISYSIRLTPRRPRSTWSAVYDSAGSGNDSAGLGYRSIFLPPYT